MRCYFAIACWILLLFAYLQAKPTPNSTTNDLEMRINMLDQVSCGNMTFTTPDNVQAHCMDAALKCVMGELEVALNNCTDTDRRIYDTLECMENLGLDTVPTTSPECKWDNKEYGQPFEVFVKNIKSLAKQKNSQR